MGLGGPVELASELESVAEALHGEVVADDDPEVLPADDQTNDGVDATRRGEDVLTRTPRLGPDLTRDHDQVQRDLGALLDGECVEGAALGHDRLERVPETTSVDATGAVLVLVRTLDRLLEDDHPLERAGDVGVQTQHEVVGLTLRIRLPVVHPMALGQVEPAVDGLPQSLLTEHLQSRHVVETLRGTDGERPPLALLGVEDRQSSVPMLAIIDREVCPLAGDQQTVLVGPRTLEVTTDGIEQHSVRGHHRLGDLEDVPIRQLAIDAVGALTEAIDSTDVEHLLCREHEREDLDISLLNHAGRKGQWGGHGRGRGGHLPSPAC